MYNLPCVISFPLQEFLVKNADRVELMAMLGIFGGIISAIQMYPWSRLYEDYWDFLFWFIFSSHFRTIFLTRCFISSNQLLALIFAEESIWKHLSLKLKHSFQHLLSYIWSYLFALSKYLFVLLHRNLYAKWYWSV